MALPGDLGRWQTEDACQIPAFLSYYYRRHGKMGKNETFAVIVHCRICLQEKFYRESFYFTALCTVSYQAGSIGWQCLKVSMSLLMPCWIWEGSCTIPLKDNSCWREYPTGFLWMPLQNRELFFSWSKPLHNHKLWVCFHCFVILLQIHRRSLIQMME